MSLLATDSGIKRSARTDKKNSLRCFSIAVLLNQLRLSAADLILSRDRKALPLLFAYRPSELMHQRGFPGKKSVAQLFGHLVTTPGQGTSSIACL